MEYLRRRFDTLYLVLQVWVDGATVCLACLTGYWIFVRTILPAGEATLAMYKSLFLLILFVVLMCFWVLGMYRPQKSILNVEEYRVAFKSTLAAFFVVTACIFLLKAASTGPDTQPDHWIYRLTRPVHEMLDLSATDMYSRVLFVLVFFLVFLFTVVQRAIAFRVLSRLHARGIGNINVAIFGTGEMGRRLQQKLRLFPTLGYHLIGFLDRREDVRQEDVGGVPVIGNEHELDHLRDRYRISRVIIAKPELGDEELVALCNQLERFGIQYQVVPRLYHFFTRRFTVETLDSLPLITPQALHGRPVYQFVKRAMDVAISATVLAVASPLMLVIAWLIKRESPGPVFFSQIRVGAHNRSFRMVKFRTMYADMCGDDVTPQHSGDPRITPLGRFLRKTSLDELPQLWNVLRGDMSLVGPRPEMPFIVDEYDELQRMRLDTKPGITGLWQVSEARKAPIHENVDYDLYYIENQSVFLDITIFLLTLAAMVRIRGTH